MEIEVEVYRRKDVIRKTQRKTHTNKVLNWLYKIFAGYQEEYDYGDIEPLGSILCYCTVPRQGDEIVLNDKIYYVWRRIINDKGDVDLLV